MYKAVLVDDEYWTLMGIQQTFNWENYSFMIDGAYSSAAEALAAIKTGKPDVVFTDICMPGMNGMELIKELRRLELDIEVIIISGFSEFEYAQQAIQHGAFDYCLKPIDEDTTDPLLERLKKKLDYKKQQKMQALLDLIGNGNSMEGKSAAALGLPSGRKLYQVIQFSGAAEHDVKEVLDHMPAADYATLLTARRRYVIINCEQEATATLMRYSGPDIIGLSMAAEQFHQLPLLAEQAAIAAATSFIIKDECVFKYSPRQTAKMNTFLARAIHLLENGHLVRFQTLIGTIPALWKESGFSAEDLCYVWNQLLMHVELTSSSQIKTADFSLLDWQQMEGKFSDIHDFCQTLFDEVSYCYNVNNQDTGSDADDSGKPGFNKMLAYLHKNYNQQIKLKDLANMFYINKNYASFLFQKYTGMTYSEYINKLRMDKARELLIQSSLPIAEVAEHAGYPDYFYFSRLFKKTFGVSPTAFRKEPSAFIQSTSAD
ncbi:MAG: two component transcriptional regulator, AraC family [Paenibacillaceae bacterium]|nr:two component transcriptional regulator, AraC family [Paenibacillaceae bacterium]